MALSKPCRRCTLLYPRTQRHLDLFDDRLEQLIHFALLRLLGLLLHFPQLLRAPPEIVTGARISPLCCVMHNRDTTFTKRTAGLGPFLDSSFLMFSTYCWIFFDLFLFFIPNVFSSALDAFFCGTVASTQTPSHFFQTKPHPYNHSSA